MTFSMIIPKYRIILRAVGILIPATMHALYNATNDTNYWIVPVLFSVRIFTIYLRKTKIIKQKIT